MVRPRRERSDHPPLRKVSDHRRRRARRVVGVRARSAKSAVSSAPALSARISASRSGESARSSAMVTTSPDRSR
ncbi:hypothetical protein CURTO8I2_320023 [Curtobacterium sp. 8I-2]|nr:hypothetical protein CURTO8I2_320023 [Curtobacterium sp. 8I-2]